VSSPPTLFFPPPLFFSPVWLPLFSSLFVGPFFPLIFYFFHFPPETSFLFDRSPVLDRGFPLPQSFFVSFFPSRLCKGTCFLTPPVHWPACWFLLCFSLFFTGARSPFPALPDSSRYWVFFPCLPQNTRFVLRGTPFMFIGK